LMLQAGLLPLMDLSQLTGVILFSAVSHGVSLVVAVWLIVQGFRCEFTKCPFQPIGSEVC